MALRVCSFAALALLGAMTVVGAVATLIEYTKNPHVSKIRSIAETSLNIIDALIYDITGFENGEESNRYVDSHSLMRSEMDRQQRDLAVLRGPHSRNDVIRLKQEATFASLTGNYWYQ